MPISAADIVFKGSNVAATTGNATANAGPGTNLGDFATSGALTDATLNNLFPDVTGDENAASQVDYQCMFVHNNHGTLTLQNTVAYLSAEVAGGTTIAIGVDPTAASAVAAGTAQAVTIANKNTAPAGVTFTAPTTKGAGITIGNLAPGQVRAIWIRRTSANTAAVNNDGATLRVEGDTAA